MHGSVSGAAFGSSATPVYGRVYRTAGCLLRVCADDEFRAQLFEQHLGDYQIRPATAAPGSETFSAIEFKSAESRPAVPAGLATQEIAGGSYAVGSERIYLEVEDSLIVVGTCDANVVRVWIGETPHALQPLSLATVLSYAVNAALRRCGRFELHAAGLTPPDGCEGALIIGDSGSGKSTLTMRLISGGWRYLSDDRLLLGEDADEIVAWGWRRVFSLTEETLRSCGEPNLNEALLGLALDDPGKRHVDPRVIFSDRFVPSCRPRVLMFTKLSGNAESQVIKLTPAEAMTGLLRQCPWACYDPGAGRNHLRLLAQLVRQSRAYQLLAGRELLDEPERAALLLGPYLN